VGILHHWQYRMLQLVLPVLVHHNFVPCKHKLLFDFFHLQKGNEYFTYHSLHPSHISIHMKNTTTACLRERTEAEALRGQGAEENIWT
jgi:elongation factor P--beta-lysine ligase